jgi:hypothetical protein
MMISESNMIGRDVLGYPDMLSMVNGKESECSQSLGMIGKPEGNGESEHHDASCEISEVPVVSDKGNIVPILLEELGHHSLDFGVVASRTKQASIANKEKYGFSIDLARDIILGLVNTVVDERRGKPDASHEILKGNRSCIPNEMVKNNGSLYSDPFRNRINGKPDETLLDQIGLPHKNYQNCCLNTTQDSTITKDGILLFENCSSFMNDPIERKSIELSELKNKHPNETLGIIESLPISVKQNISLSIDGQTLQKYASQNWEASRKEIEPETLTSLDLMDGFSSSSSVPKYSEYDMKTMKKIENIDETSVEIGFLDEEMQLMRGNLEKEVKQGLKIQRVVDDYGDTMIKMIEGTKKLKEDYQVRYLGLLAEKNKSDANFTKMELVFNDLSRRYENLKALNQMCREVGQYSSESKRFTRYSHPYSFLYRT